MNMDGIRRIQKNSVQIQRLPEQEADPVAHRRRSFLKYVMLGSGVLVIGKIFGSSLDFFSGAEKRGVALSFKDLRMAEQGREIRILDGGGDEVLTFDKAA